MRRIKDYGTYVFLNAKTAFNSKYTYKAASFLTFITQVVLILAQYFLWKALYKNNVAFNGFNLQDMIAYIVVSFSMGLLYPFEISNIFGQAVKSGDIVHSLLKPIPIEFQLFTQSLGRVVYKIIFTSVPILLTGVIFLGVRLQLSINRLLLVLFFCVSSYLFIFVLELCIGILSFYTQNLWGINSFKQAIISILSGKMLPINFYPQVFINIIYYLPFSTIFFVPINILLNKPVKNIWIFVAIIWMSILLLTLIYRKLSKKMLKKLMIQGG